MLRKIAVIIAASVLVLTTSAAAAPYRASAILDHNNLERSLAASKLPGKHAIAPIRFRSFIPGVGAINVRLNSQRSFNLAQEVTLLRGTYRVGRGHAEPISAALYYPRTAAATLTLTFQHSRRSSLASTRLVELQVKQPLSASRKVVQIRSPSGLTLQNLGCDTATTGSPRFGTASIDDHLKYPTSAATFRVIEISTEADSSWIGLYGGSSNSRILAILNSAELIYERDLGLTYSLATQGLQSLALGSSTDPLTALTDFRTKGEQSSALGDADAYHLFTNRDLDGNVTGIAYLARMCDGSGYTYGLTAHVNSALDYIIFAHELGHNLAADHSPDSSSVMSAFVDTSHTAFSATSKSEIAAYLGIGGDSCLASVSVTNTPTPTPTSGGGGATPSPDSTTTPTPTPTATSGGSTGGGNDPGADPQLPAVNFEVSLNRVGEISGEIELSGGLQRSACTLMLQLSKDSFFESISSVELADGMSSSISLSASLPFKVKRPISPKKGDQNIYLRAAYRCSDAGQPGLSAKIKLNAGRVRGKAISKNSYINKLTRLFPS